MVYFFRKLSWGIWVQMPVFFQALQKCVTSLRLIVVYLASVFNHAGYINYVERSHVFTFKACFKPWLLKSRREFSLIYIPWYSMLTYYSPLHRRRRGWGDGRRGRRWMGWLMKSHVFFFCCPFSVHPPHLFAPHHFLNCCLRRERRLVSMVTFVLIYSSTSQITEIVRTIKSISKDLFKGRVCSISALASVLSFCCDFSCICVSL